MNSQQKANLAIHGEYTVLTIDPSSNELIDLYIPTKEVYMYLIERFGGNKAMITLRGPWDWKRDLLSLPREAFER